MRTIAEIRRANLELLIRAEGTAGAVAGRVGTSEVYLSQLRRGTPDAKTKRPREMGTGLARRLEAEFKKATGWMDEAHYSAQSDANRPLGAEERVTVTLNTREMDAVLAMRAISQKQREMFVTQLMQAAEDAAHFAAEVLSREGVTATAQGNVGAGLPVRPDGEQLDSVPGELLD